MISSDHPTRRLWQLEMPEWRDTRSMSILQSSLHVHGAWGNVVKNVTRARERVHMDEWAEDRWRCRW